MKQITSKEMFKKEAIESQTTTVKVTVNKEFWVDIPTMMIDSDGAITEAGRDVAEDKLYEVLTDHIDENGVVYLVQKMEVN